MKKYLISLLVVATLVSCSKTETTYDAPAEIGFAPVSNNITKAAIVGNTYPEDLNMYVSSFMDERGTTDVVEYEAYFINASFVYKNVVEDKKAWGGDPAQYWPNVNTLCFMGVSASEGVVAENITCTAGATPTISISSYTQPAPDAAVDGSTDDLMWFPQTGQYGKSTAVVPVSMFHALSWLTFKVQGDAVTGTTGSTYKVTDITINGLKKSGSVVLGTANHSATWELTGVAESLEVYKNDTGVALAGTCTVNNGSEIYEPKNVENHANSILVLPQTPVTIDLTYQYESPAGGTVTEVVEGLKLQLNDTNSLPWDDGYHYVYTITIKANEILIAPTPEKWADGTSGSITIQ